MGGWGRGGGKKWRSSLSGEARGGPDKNLQRQNNRSSTFCQKHASRKEIKTREARFLSGKTIKHLVWLGWLVKGLAHAALVSVVRVNGQERGKKEGYLFSKRSKRERKSSPWIEKNQTIGHDPRAACEIKKPQHTN